MEWKQPFVIYRITPDAKLFQVYEASNIKEARYWLTYIAQPGDVLCRTPIHPKHSQQGTTAEYWSHKESSGKSSSREANWKKIASTKNFTLSLPSAPDDPTVVTTEWPPEPAPVGEEAEPPVADRPPEENTQP